MSLMQVLGLQSARHLVLTQLRHISYGDWSSDTTHQVLQGALLSILMHPPEIKAIGGVLFPITAAILLCFRYTHPFFGSAAPILTHPPAEARRGAAPIIFYSVSDTRTRSSGAPLLFWRILLQKRGGAPRCSFHSLSALSISLRHHNKSPIRLTGQYLFIGGSLESP